MRKIDNIQIVTFLEVEKGISYEQIKTETRPDGSKKLVFLYEDGKITDDILNEFPKSWTSKIIDAYRTLLKILPRK